jgi:CheY-like chemotaxis protein
VLDADYARLNAGAVPGAYALVAISDTGTGMSAETLDHVFEPFFTTKGPGHGTGLGLSMAYGFVKQSGGHIKIYSEPRRGTTVRVYLPRATTAGMIEYAAPIVAPSAGGSETILVVEDNEQLRITVAAQLASLGYRVLQAEDAHAALEILERRGRQVDLLFSDVVMPGPLDGYGLAKRARQDRPEIKVLLTSGFPGEALARMGADASAFRLLGKPYRKQDLARAIKETLAS